MVGNLKLFPSLFSLVSITSCVNSLMLTINLLLHIKNELDFALFLLKLTRKLKKEMEVAVIFIILITHAWCYSYIIRILTSAT